MKKFETPRMRVLKLELNDVMRTSGCFETHACKECYCSLVGGCPPWTCEGLSCPTLSDFD